MILRAVDWESLTPEQQRARERVAAQATLREQQMAARPTVWSSTYCRDPIPGVSNQQCVTTNYQAEPTESLSALLPYVLGVVAVGALAWWVWRRPKPAGATP